MAASMTLARDRPWLLPSNRKLRNLFSISLRNLSTVSEDAVESVLPKRATHSLRRRSTLEWAKATPQKRQEKLENVTAERMADVFFSLHVQGIEQPVYLSEVVESTMNPTFRHLDWSACGPGITRLDHVVLRFWFKSAKMESWKQLLEISLHLKCLQYVGKSLDQFHRALPQNAVIFHLPDGVYTSFPSLSHSAPPPTAPAARATSTRTLPTSSFDALLRLAKLDDSIQDALATRSKIAADLEQLLGANKDALTDRDRVPEAQDRLKTIDYAKKTVEKQLEKSRKQQEERRIFLANRRELMKQDLDRRKQQSIAMQKDRAELPALRDEHKVKTKAIQNQRRRICEDLQKIYPIHTLPTKPLAFNIRDLHPPNSDTLDEEPPERVAAAFGHIAHVLLLLSYYLAQLIPYPLNPRSSTSTVEDPISLLKTTASTTQNHQDERQLRTYPLFNKGVPRFRFEYGVFLLNKDLQILLENAFNVRVLDIGQTLPNLKYLLYMATAGEGELPARKAGGVRGLMRTHGAGSPSEMSRQGSNDSASSALSGLLWHEGKKTANGKPKGAVESLRRNMVGMDGKVNKG